MVSETLVQQMVVLMTRSHLVDSCMSYIHWLATATAVLLLSAVAAFPLAGTATAGPTLLFDAASGKVLYAEDQDQVWHPASLTKIMTAYVVFEALKSGKITLATKIACSEAAHALPPSKLGLPVGAEITVELALKLLIVKSANDVALMLAEAVGGSEASFSDLMNKTAKRLGMTRTNFVNPHGLPAPEQVTTARDLAKLSSAVMREFPEYAHLFTLPSVKVGRRFMRSHNLLLRTYDGADGLKTGFICDSGYNVVASATRDGRRLVAVVLGETSGQERAVRAATLLEHGFQNQAWKEFLSPATLDSMALSTRDVSPVSIRQTVVSWECGNRRRRGVRNVASARQRARQARIRAAKAKTAKPRKAETEAAATAAPPTTTKPVAKTAVAAEGGAQPKPKPAAKKKAAAEPKAE